MFKWQTKSTTAAWTTRAKSLSRWWQLPLSQQYSSSWAGRSSASSAPLPHPRQPSWVILVPRRQKPSRSSQRGSLWSWCLQHFRPWSTCFARSFSVRSRSPAWRSRLPASKPKTTEESYSFGLVCNITSSFAFYMNKNTLSGNNNIK